MNRPVIIVPEISLSNWFDTGNQNDIEEQIIDAIVNKLEPDGHYSFFNSSLKDIPDPSSLKDISHAVDLFLSAINKKDRILIIGDYDVDGITSTALLIRFFRKVNFQNYDRFIPNRFQHGYGLTNKTVDIILSKNPNLVITVDNGITAKEEIKRIQNAGINVIVTDHHLPQESFLPNCVILNPKQETCEYPYKHLSGVGVVFLFLVAVRMELRKRGYWNNNQQEEPNLLEHLDLVALGTIADQVPLLGLNRIFAKFGLDQMTKRIHESDSGEFYYYLKVFSEKLGINSFNSEVIAFNLAPMLNATGRMKDAEEGLSFLLSDNLQKASSRYQYLERLNQKRRKKQQSMSKKASKKAMSFVKKDKGIVVYDSTFHEGLIGVIASRLVDEFFFPCVVVTDGEPGILKASCRSKNENLMDILNECRDFMIQFGGHANAAGCSLKKENLVPFHERFTDICSEIIPKDKEYTIKATIEVELNMLTYGLINRLRVFEPYGQENRKPIFMLSNVKLPIPTILTGKHLKWSFERDLEMLFWNGAESLQHASTYDVAFTIGENIYRGERKRQLVVQSIVAGG